jgi:hypothetical protein
MYMVVWGHFSTYENDTEKNKNKQTAGYAMHVSARTSEPATDTMAPFALGFHRAKQQVVAENKVRLRDELLCHWCQLGDVFFHKLQMIIKAPLTESVFVTKLFLPH